MVIAFRNHRVVVASSLALALHVGAAFLVLRTAPHAMPAGRQEPLWARLIELEATAPATSIVEENPDQIAPKDSAVKPLVETPSANPPPPQVTTLAPVEETPRTMPVLLTVIAPPDKPLIEFAPTGRWCDDVRAAPANSQPDSEEPCRPHPQEPR